VRQRVPIGYTCHISTEGDIGCRGGKGKSGPEKRKSGPRRGGGGRRTTGVVRPPCGKLNLSAGEKDANRRENVTTQEFNNK